MLTRFMIFLLIATPAFASGRSITCDSVVKSSSNIADGFKQPSQPVKVYTKIIYKRWEAGKNGKFKHIPSPRIPVALVWSESHFKSKAKSKIGCRGLFQLETATAIYICKKYKIKYNKKTIRQDLLNNVHFNVEVGLANLNEEFKRADGDMKEAILSYKCGRTAITKQLYITSRQNELYGRYLKLLKAIS